MLKPRNGSLPGKQYVYSLTVVVTDERTLQRAAVARAAVEGFDAKEWRASRRGPGSDLVMLLDPGAEPPGCRLVRSDVEEI